MASLIALACERGTQSTSTNEFHQAWHHEYEYAKVSKLAPLLLSKLFDASSKPIALIE
jgi:hypothetical protein